MINLQNHLFSLYTATNANSPHLLRGQTQNMQTSRKNFIWKNEAFVCKKCGEKNPPAEKTARNHCRKCLFSIHLDEKIPGDRLSKCKGLMEPYDIDYKSEKGYQLVHMCAQCGKKMKNMLAQDDDLHEFLKVPGRNRKHIC